MRRSPAAVLLLAAILAPAAPDCLAAPPAGFIADVVQSDWNELAGVAPLADGRMLAWERGGRVWMLNQDGTRINPPMLDIHDEVGAWRDHGLLAVAPHPNFLQNGHLYLMYVVDRHHLLTFGAPDYDPNADWYYAASIGRITRYTADAGTRFETVDPASRLVLLGETKETGIPVVHQSHGVGTLLFGEDGTLLASVGDNASYESVDLGGQVSGGYVDQAVADGILKPKENVGAFRSQLVDCHCGKVLRIDPATGDGLPSNPFYDPTAPRAPRSRVWCLGLRNPFRMTIEPETGSHDPADGDPGTLVIGDVGWNVFEELNRAPSGGLDFGWPVFEGLEHMAAYAKSDVVNLDAPNPLGGGSCTEPFLRFRSLLVQDTQAPLHFWNPCGMLQAEAAQRFGVTVSTTVAGYLGSGYGKFQNASGDWIKWTANAGPAGSYTLGIRYALGSGTKSLELRVDGNVVLGSLAFASTGAATEWRVLEVPIALGSGSHTIQLTAIGSGGPDIDGIAVYAPGAGPELPASIPHFPHARALADWHHSNGQARVPSFNNGAATVSVIGGPTSPVVGSSFGGHCAVGGSRVHFDGWPEEWHDRVFFTDFVDTWVRAFRLDATGKVAEVKLFDPSIGNLTQLIARPFDETLWMVRWPGELVRVAYEPGGNQAPVVVVTHTQPWGPSPLVIDFDASSSSDPEGTALQFAWDFGDGSTASGPVVSHTFQSRSGLPQSFDVLLTVIDAGGKSSTKAILVSADNSPPVVTITSVYDGQLYPMDQKVVLPLEAAIADAEHAPNTLTCSWQTILHHNEHEHPEPPDPECTSSAYISPLGCGEETYWFEVRCTVTDPVGLSTTAVANLYPDCKGVLACGADLDRDGAVGSTDLALLLGAWGQATAAYDLDADGTVGAGDLAILLGAWGPC